MNAIGSRNRTPAATFGPAIFEEATGATALA
jgi:hypothetical protein